jgi:hypothetical protein
MDIPKGDVFAIQSGTMEPLPLYVEQESELSHLQALIAALPVPSPQPPLDRSTVDTFVESQTQFKAGPKNAKGPEPIMEYPAYRELPDDLTRVRQAIVVRFFNAIIRGEDGLIARFINNNLVTANTKRVFGETALLVAVATKNVRIVQQLLEFGADPNAFSIQVFTRPNYYYDFS